MKKVSQYSLVLITMLFVVFTCGVLLGRHTGYAVPLVQNSTERKSMAESTSAEDTVINTEVVIDGKININTASAATLKMLPGIGDTLAQRIVDYRSVNGPFNSMNDLENVVGLGVTRIEAIKKYITVGG